MDSNKTPINIKLFFAIISFAFIFILSSPKVSATEFDDALNLYSPVFDINYYSIHYPEVHQICNGNPALMLCYFIEHGMAQGQQANLEFNVITYKYKYPELQKLYGEDLSKYYIDYIIIGKEEGRNSQIYLENDMENLSGDVITPNYSTELSKSSNLISEVLTLTNQIRLNNGLAPLTTSPELQNTAAVRATEISNKFSHYRPDGTVCFTAYKECGATYFSAAENIASGKISAKQVVEAWMKSADHKSNILNPTYTHVGIGVYINKSTNEIYWSQEFTN